VPGAASGAAPGASPAPNPVEELIENGFDKVFRLLVSAAFKLCPDRDPENVAAEAIAKAWQARWSYNADAHPNPVPWLYAILRNVAIDNTRGVKNQPGSNHPLPTELASSGDIEAELYDFEILEVLRSVVEELPSAQRDALRRALSFKQGRVPEDYEEARQEAFEAVMRALREKLGGEPCLEFFARLCRLYREGFIETRD
jgi:hypothetical protein